jgi:hypothetical protein
LHIFQRPVITQHFRTLSTNSVIHHFITSRVCHIFIIGWRQLNNMRLDYLQWHNIDAIFEKTHTNRYTDSQYGDLISLLSFPWRKYVKNYKFFKLTSWKQIQFCLQVSLNEFSLLLKFLLFACLFHSMLVEIMDSKVINLQYTLCLWSWHKGHKAEEVSVYCKF